MLVGKTMTSSISLILKPGQSVNSMMVPVAMALA